MMNGWSFSESADWAIGALLVMTILAAMLV